MNGINGMNRNGVNPNRGNNKNWSKDELSNNGMNSGGKGLLEERSGLSVDDFLKIMAAEMQNQNPMGDSGGGGGSKTDYVSQLAQFTSLELMSEVVDSLDYINVLSQQQHAFSLIGKEVSLKVPEIEDGKFKTDKDGNIIMKDIEGTVEKIKFKNGLPYASVRDADDKLKDYDLGYIMQVGAKDTIIGKETPMIPLKPSKPIVSEGGEK